LKTCEGCGGTEGMDALAEDTGYCQECRQRAFGFDDPPDEPDDVVDDEEEDEVAADFVNRTVPDCRDPRDDPLYVLYEEIADVFGPQDHIEGDEDDGDLADDPEDNA